MFLINYSSLIMTKSYTLMNTTIEHTTNHTINKGGFLNNGGGYVKEIRFFIHDNLIMLT